MPSLIDPEQMQSMSEGIEEQFLGLIQDFAKQVCERVANAENSQSMFHQFKGASASLGLATFSSQSAEYEKLQETAQELPEDWSQNYLKLIEDSVTEANALLKR